MIADTNVTLISMAEEKRHVMQKQIREKHHRLPVAAYKGFVAVAFTANVQERKRLFTDSMVYKIFQEILLNELKSYCCSAYVYLFMPDHLHTIIAGEKDDADIKGCIEMFKQRTGFWLYTNKSSYHWQKDYYDHVIRKEDDMNAQIRYILLNPVRAGLVDSWKKYPYKGSTKFNFEEWDEEII